MNDPVDDVNNYKKWGVYHNPEDSRIIVPKRARWAGFTFNFARKETYLILIALILILILVLS